MVVMILFVGNKVDWAKVGNDFHRNNKYFIHKKQENLEKLQHLLIEKEKYVVKVDRDKGEFKDYMLYLLLYIVSYYYSIDRNWKTS